MCATWPLTGGEFLKIAVNAVCETVGEVNTQIPNLSDMDGGEGGI